MQNMIWALLGVLVLLLDLWAIRSSRSSGFYSSRQKALQAALAILVPVLGAALVIYLSRSRKDPPRGDFPPSPRENRDAINGSISNFRP
jgi:hypothetical protein